MSPGPLRALVALVLGVCVAQESLYAVAAEAGVATAEQAIAPASPTAVEDAGDEPATDADGASSAGESSSDGSASEGSSGSERGETAAEPSAAEPIAATADAAPPVVAEPSEEPAPSPSSDAPSPSPSMGRGGRVASLVVGGGAAVGGRATRSIMVLSLPRGAALRDDAAAMIDDPSTTDAAMFADIIAEGRAANRLAVITGVAGVLVLGSGAALLSIGLGRDRPNSVAASLTPGGAGLVWRGRF
ncbi:MAG: hypothetical protein H6710_01040 [Myxococcales bacterium]|nr:hypothetical protein [Myxococcales bacterium]